MACSKIGKNDGAGIKKRYHTKGAKKCTVMDAERVFHFLVMSALTANAIKQEPNYTILARMQSESSSLILAGGFSIGRGL